MVVIAGCLIVKNNKILMAKENKNGFLQDYLKKATIKD